MKGEGIFSVMDKLDLTTLEIFQSRMDNRFLMKGMKEWDDGLEFRHYGKNFSYVDMLTENYKAVGTEELVAGFREMGLGDYLDRVKQLLSEGRHEGIEFFYHRKKDIRVSFCKHSVTLGLENRQHVMRAGAMRRHEPDEPEIEVIVDGLNLSRAMTYKNAVSALPYGGCKTVVQCAPVKLDDYETMGFLSYVPDRCRVFVGADMGLDEEMVDVIRSTFTRNFVGGTKSPLASTGTPTAYGEFLAIKEACDITFDTRDLSGRTIAIQGLGHVGFPLAEYLLDDGAGLIVTDIDRDKVGALQQRYGTDLVRYVSPDAEIELAKKVAEAGILFVVDWAHNNGGVIAASVLWQLQEEATEEQLNPKIELPCRTNFRRLLEEAMEKGTTPTELVYEKVEKMVYSSDR
ncbi:MAG: hypothetical protein JRJ70_08450 [Deltaproteobacteria bacterium]|nr:hypothetical protein [Deltaproteobacteria bacterium]